MTDVKGVDLDTTASRPVYAPDEIEHDDAGRFTVNLAELQQLLTNSGQGSNGTNGVARRGGVSVNDIAGVKAMGKNHHNNSAIKVVDNFKNLSKFSALMKASGITDTLDNASAKGGTYTVFAPTNDALVQMPNRAYAKMEKSSDTGNELRDAFVKQHIVLNMDEQYASAQEDLDGMSAAIESLQEGAHVSVQDDIENIQEMAKLAVQHDDSGEVKSAARIVSTLQLPNSSQIHIVDSVLA